MKHRHVLKTALTPWGLLRAAGLATSLASLVGFLGPWWWILDLFSHFRVQYALALLVLSLAFALGQRWISVLLLGVVWSANVVPLGPLFWASSEPPPPGSRLFRAMLLNVNADNDQFDRTRAAIRAFDPEFVVLLEVNPAWLAALRDLRPSYPHGITHPREDRFGIALFSKVPTRNARVVAIGPAGIPSITADLVLDGEILTLWATHAVPPVSRVYAKRRDRHLAAIAHGIGKPVQPTLLLGDLNTTPWSPLLRELTRQTGLADCTRGRGIQPTWPTSLPLLRIPIDHCFHSEHTLLRDKRIGPSVGSDHYPVLIEFAFRENPAPRSGRIHDRSADSTSACSITVCVAFSCLSGG